MHCVLFIPSFIEMKEQQHNFSIILHQLLHQYINCSPLILLRSGQTAAAVGRSLRMSSLLQHWTSTGTWAASSVKSATRCSMPSTSASKSENIALRVHTFAANDLHFYSLSDGSCWMSQNFHLMNFIFAQLESLCNDVRKFGLLLLFIQRK